VNGKGSKPRPLSISRDEYARRFDETFSRRPGNAFLRALDERVRAEDDAARDKLNVRLFCEGARSVSGTT